MELHTVTTKIKIVQVIFARSLSPKIAGFTLGPPQVQSSRYQREASVPYERSGRPGGGVVRGDILSALNFKHGGTGDHSGQRFTEVSNGEKSGCH